jgi:hypothetical protein
MKQRLVISYDKDEFLPILVNVGHNLKPENLYISDVELLLDMQDYYIIHKKVVNNEKSFYIFLTHSENFIRGFLYYNNKEFIVNDHRTYSSLQIGDYSYDNISIVRLEENPFT